MTRAADILLRMPEVSFPSHGRAFRFVLRRGSERRHHRPAPHGSNQLSKLWCRCPLAVRTSPRSWRRTERLLERARKCGLRIVADNLGNLGEGRAGVAE